jgi:hypothetical protein
LKSPHHGSNTSSCAEFLEAVAPRFVIITAGAGNRYNLPSADVMNRYREIDTQIYRTDLMGAIEISSDGQNLFFRLGGNRHSTNAGRTGDKEGTIENRRKKSATLIPSHLLNWEKLSPV